MGVALSAFCVVIYFKLRLVLLDFSLLAGSEVTAECLLKLICPFLMSI